MLLEQHWNLQFCITLEEFVLIHYSTVLLGKPDAGLKTPEGRFVAWSMHHSPSTSDDP